MRAPHGASADHKPIEQPLRWEIKDEQELEHLACPAGIARFRTGRTRQRSQNKRKRGRPERTGHLFQSIQKFHKEGKMRFAKNIWPGLLAVTAAAFAAGAPALAQ